MDGVHGAARVEIYMFGTKELLDRGQNGVVHWSRDGNLHAL